MHIGRKSRFALAVLSLLSLPLSGQTTPAKRASAAPPAPPAWIAKSNEYAKILLEIQTKFGPESASQLGIDGYDREVMRLPLDYNDQQIAAYEEALKTLQAKLVAEKDPAVKQDLQIMIDSANDSIEGLRLGDKYQLPYFNLPQALFGSFRGLLDEQIPAERRAAALVRLKRYTGEEKGYTPITEQAKAFIRAKLANKQLIGPFKDDIEKDLANSQRFIGGIGELFKQYEISGYESSYAMLQKQLADYEAFVRAEIAPRATTDFRLPAELYTYMLKTRGNDMPVEELISRAKTSFREIQNELQALAPLVAKEKGIASTDYRDVIRELKKKQLVGKDILPHYETRITALEKLIRDNKVVTLPSRAMQIRLASEAESAATPAPNMRPPRMIGNTGERGTFVLPLRIPAEPGKEDLAFDDFTHEAASWTLTVHEGRPGHELQFSSIVEKGVSQARMMFAFNSVNVEGWALYAEAEMKPLLPLDGQLISLQSRLLRAARAFIDPSLQLGRMTREEAFRILQEDVVQSKGMATQEVERYTFRAPGQAPSYYVGYARLMELRTDAERMLGAKFDRQAFHDFILAQGLLPPSLLREAVMKEFVAPRLKG